MSDNNINFVPFVNKGPVNIYQGVRPVQNAVGHLLIFALKMIVLQVFSLNKVIGQQLFPLIISLENPKNPLFFTKNFPFHKSFKSPCIYLNRQVTYKHALIRFILKPGHLAIVN